MNDTLQKVINNNSNLQSLKANSFTSSFLHFNLNSFLGKCNLVNQDLEKLKDDIRITTNIKYEANYTNTLDSLNKTKENISVFNQELQADYEKMLVIAEELYDEYLVLYKKHQGDFDNYLENAKNYIKKYNFVREAIRTSGSNIKETRINEMKSDLNRYKTRFDSCVKNMSNINNQIEELLEKGLKKYR